MSIGAAVNPALISSHSGTSQIRISARRKQRRKLRWSLKLKKTVQNLSLKQETQIFWRVCGSLPAPSPPRNLARLCMHVPSYLVSSQTSLWWYSEIARMGRSVYLSLEESWRYDGPSWGGQPGEGCDVRSWCLCLPGPACTPPPWSLQFSCWLSWAWCWPSDPARCSLETPCSQQWLCCCCCSSLGSRSSSGGSSRTPILFHSG